MIRLVVTFARGIDEVEVQGTSGAYDTLYVDLSGANVDIHRKS